MASREIEALSLRRYMENKFGVKIDPIHYEEEKGILRCILRKGENVAVCQISESLVESGNVEAISNILDQALVKLGVVRVIKEYNPSLRGGSI